MILYKNFDLRIRSDGDGFVVSALRGSQAASESFEIDPSLSWDLEDMEKRVPGAIRKRGSLLFDALMRGRIRDLYHQELGRIGGDSKAGARIRIHFDPSDVRLRRLIQIPWEILHDRSADGGNFTALNPRLPIVRVIDSVDQPLAPIPGPLKSVLLAQSNSLDAELDLDRERVAVERAFAGLDVRLVVLTRSTRSTLLEKISLLKPQIVHFMGHGRFDESLGEGVLVLSDERGEEDWLKASTFAAFFAGRPMPRLVILSACLTATSGVGQAAGPFASVAMRLTAGGVPAVIAMQSEVLDADAIRFTDRLYSSFAQGDPIEAAVANARAALQANRQETLAWAVPVLFMRGASEDVPFDAQQTESVPVPSQYQSNVTNTGPVELQINAGYINRVQPGSGGRRK